MVRRCLLPAGLLLVVVAPLLLPAFHVTLLNYIGLYALVALGLVLLTGVGGLTSFGQAAFMGLGAYATAVLTTTYGWSPWVTLPMSLLATGLVALALAVVTLRLSGHYLPLGTIAWGIALYYLFGTVEAFGGHSGITDIPPVEVLGWSLDTGHSFYFLIWLAVILSLWATRNLLDSRVGRGIRALKGGALMAESMGVNTTLAKTQAFLIAALLAGLSGWLYAHLQRFVNPTPFGLGQGIEYLFMAVVGGAGHVLGAVVGATIITVLKQWLQDWLPEVLGQSGNFEVIVFGLLMVLVLQRARDGVWPLIGHWVPTPPPAPPAVGSVPQLATRMRLPVGHPLLEVRGVSKHFGGLVANRDMSLDLRAGEVLALIGPNGAGKSTLFNLISGVLPLTSGEIRFRGGRCDGLPARALAALGMGRTFQHVKLLADMTVLENVALGAHLRGRHGVLAAGLHIDRYEEARLLDEARRCLERVGLEAHAQEAAGSLPLGKQRILEIARALAGDPDLLLLDEPAAGLRYLEKQALADLIRGLRADGMGVLLVEHDMEFVMELADRVVVMEFGETIAEGTPAEVQCNPAVLAAYLGGVE